MLDAEIAADKKSMRRATLFGPASSGCPAFATIVNETDPGGQESIDVDRDLRIKGDSALNQRSEFSAAEM